MAGNSDCCELFHKNHKMVFAFFIFVSIAIVISQNFLCNLFELTFIAQIGFLV